MSTGSKSLKLDIGLGKLAKALIPMPVKLKLGAKPPAPQPAKNQAGGLVKAEAEGKACGKEGSPGKSGA